MQTVPAGGGETTEVPAHPKGQNDLRFPDFLPDGRHFLFYVAGDAQVSGIYIGSLDGRTPQRLVAAASAGVFVEPDRLAYLQDGALVARRLDTNRSRVTGEAETLATSIEPDDRGFFGFSASATGVMAYRVSRGTESRGTWFDGTGKVIEIEERLQYNGPEFSPDGRYVAYDDTVNGNRDVWIRDLERGGTRNVTTHSATDGYPVWSQDNERLVFESNRDGTFDLWIGQISRPGEETRLYGEDDLNEIPMDWSNDDAFVLFMRADNDYLSSDLLALPMSGEDRSPIVVANEPYEERRGVFSPDGHWVAYDTNRSGRFEIVVQAFPEPNEKIFLSQTGSDSPRWSADGTEIYFIAPDGDLMVSEVVATPSSFEFETPKKWFPTQALRNPFNHPYDVRFDPTSGEKRVLVENILVDENPPPITVVLNWRFRN